MHVPQDLMWWEILKSFWISSVTKQGPCLDLFFLNLDAVALSFVFDNYCLTIDKLDSKDLSHKLQTNYAISYFFIYI